MDQDRTHEFTIKRLVATRNSTGGFSDTYTTAARGTRPIAAVGRAIIMSPKEKLDHGVRADIFGWKFLIRDADPQVTVQDIFEFKFAPTEATRVVKVKVASHPRSADLALYKVIGEEDASEN